MYRALAQPLRVLSLRTIVIVAACRDDPGAVLLGTWVWVGVTNDQYSQLDRRLDSVSSLGDVSTLLRSAAADGRPARARRGRSGAHRPHRRHDGVGAPPTSCCPQLPNGYANTTINGVEYRVRTITAGIASIALGAPLAETQPRIDELHLAGVADLRAA